MADTPQPEGMQQPYTSHIITEADVRMWLAEHGLSADDIAHASISVGWDTGGVRAWLDVQWYKRDGQGHRYRDPRYRDPDDRGQAAMGSSSVPLHSWPPLTPAATTA